MKLLYVVPKVFKAIMKLYIGPQIREVDMKKITLKLIIFAFKKTKTCFIKRMVHKIPEFFFKHIKI